MVVGEARDKGPLRAGFLRDRLRAVAVVVHLAAAVVAVLEWEGAVVVNPAEAEERLRVET